MSSLLGTFRERLAGLPPPPQSPVRSNTQRVLDWHFSNMREASHNGDASKAKVVTSEDSDEDRPSMQGHIHRQQMQQLDNGNKGLHKSVTTAYNSDPVAKSSSSPHTSKAICNVVDFSDEIKDCSEAYIGAGLDEDDLSLDDKLTARKQPSSHNASISRPCQASSAATPSAQPRPSSKAMTPSAQSALAQTQKVSQARHSRPPSQQRAHIEGHIRGKLDAMRISSLRDVNQMYQACIQAATTAAMDALQSMQTSAGQRQSAPLAQTQASGNKPSGVSPPVKASTLPRAPPQPPAKKQAISRPPAQQPMIQFQPLPTTEEELPHKTPHLQADQHASSPLRPMNTQPGMPQRPRGQFRLIQ